MTLQFWRATSKRQWEVYELHYRGYSEPLFLEISTDTVIEEQLGISNKPNEAPNIN